MALARRATLRNVRCSRWSASAPAVSASPAGAAMTDSSAARHSRRRVVNRRRAERAPQLHVRGRPLRPDVPGERVQVLRPDQVAGQLGQLRDVDVEVAARGGDLPEPPELRHRPLADALGQHVPEQLEHRPGAADGDPEVVQVLDVEVAADAVERGLHLGEVVQQGPGHRDGGRCSAAVIRRVRRAGWPGTGSARIVSDHARPAAGSFVSPSRFSTQFASAS